MKTLRNVFSAMFSPFDLRDGVLVIGLGLLAAGLSYVSIGLSFGVPGAILVYVAIFIRPAAAQVDSEIE